MEIITNYSLAMGFTIAFQKIHDKDLEDYLRVFLNEEEKISIYNDQKSSETLEKSFVEYRKEKGKKLLFFKNPISGVENKIKRIEQDLAKNEILSKIDTFLTYKYKLNKLSIRTDINSSDLNSIERIEKALHSILKIPPIKHKYKSFNDSILALKFRYRKTYNNKKENYLKNIKNTKLKESLETSSIAYATEIFVKKIKEKVYYDSLSLRAKSAFLKEDKTKFISFLKVSNDSFDKKMYANNQEFIENYDKTIRLLKLEKDYTKSFNKEELYSMYDKYKDGIKKEQKIKKKLRRTKKKLEQLKNKKSISNSNGFINIEKAKKTIPFDLLMDIVTTSLCETKELTDRGFFKQKINYQHSVFFQELSQDAKDKIEQLKFLIDANVTNYIQNYDVFKEVAANLKEFGKNPSNIIKELKKKYSDEFSKIWLELFDKRKEILSIKITSEDVVRLTEQFKTATLHANENNEEIASSIKTLEDQIAELEKLKLDTFTKNGEKIKAVKKIIDTVNAVKNINTKIEDLKNELNASIQLTQKILLDTSDKSLKNTSDELKEIKSSQNNTQTVDNTKNINEQNFNIEVDSIIAIIKKNIGFFNTDKKELDRIKKLILTLETELDSFKKNGLNILLDALSKKLISDTLKTEKTTDTIYLQRYADFGKKLYKRVEQLKQKPITIKDIYEIKEDFIPELIALKLLSTKNKDVLNSWLSFIEDIIPFLYVKAFDQIQDKDISAEKITKVVDLLKFISNLDNLNKAETFEYVLHLFSKGNEYVYKTLPDGKFKNIHRLFSNAVDKYTLVNTLDQYIEVDVASFLVELEEYFEKNNDNRWGFYLSIGISQNVFFKDQPIPTPDNPSNTFNSVSIASEKVGVKYRIQTFQRPSDYTNTVKDDIYLSKKSPFINEWYLNLYGSGLLYTLADATTNQNFDYPHVGFGTGIRFYNALDFNINIGIPLSDKLAPLQSPFIGFGFDIPLSEYLTKSKAKNAKRKLKSQK
ncbi:MAG: hypothetical protein AAF611_23150 [Bacteroidota bacterium]